MVIDAVLLAPSWCEVLNFEDKIGFSALMKIKNTNIWYYLELMIGSIISIKQMSKVWQQNK